MEMNMRMEQGDVGAELGRGFEEVFPEMSIQARRALSARGVVTAADLVALTGEELLAVKYVGRSTVAEIERRVREMGLTLGAPMPTILVADAGAPDIEIEAESVTVEAEEASAIQPAMNPKLRDERAFLAEYQNEPIEAPPEPDPAPEREKPRRGARPEKDTLRAAFERALEAKDYDEATRLQGLLAAAGEVVRFTKRHPVIKRAAPEPSPRRFPPEPKGGPRCRKCGSTWLKVDHTSRVGKFVIRYRICNRCNARTTTRERAVGKEPS